MLPSYEHGQEVETGVRISTCGIRPFWLKIPHTIADAKDSRGTRQEDTMRSIALGMLLLTYGFLQAADPNPIEKSLAIQRAVAEAKTFLAARQPADAVQSLESVLDHINGDADFLALLRQAYSEELKKEKLKRIPEPKRLADLESKLAILNKADTPPQPEAKPNPKIEDVPSPKIEEIASPPPAKELPLPTPANARASELLQQACQLFIQAQKDSKQYREAATLFAEAHALAPEFSKDQLAAWSYCRIKIAAETWNQSRRDASATNTAVREIESALELVPDHNELQNAGRKLIADVGGKPRSPVPKSAVASAGGKWTSLESDNFRARFQGSPEPIRELLTQAEEARKTIFTRWSTPSASAWQPKCDLVIHENAKEFATDTQQPESATGHAFIKISEQRIVERRIDLRNDDRTMTADTLPRELTYIILADLFPDRDPPRWAAIGMAVLATSTEAERCTRTLERCYRDGELHSIEAFLELKGPPQADGVTAYYVESASLVEHLVKRKDAKTFRIFLMDSQRYGLEKALDRQYGYASVKDLDQDWRRANLTTARGQTP